MLIPNQAKPHSLEGVSTIPYCGEVGRLLVRRSKWRARFI
nr:MAG TPA: hypothetical protein [Caudoviricetes sp.]